MADQLPSWADGQAKTQILEFVRSVTEPGASFVPAQDRVAAFDNDGTLWCEKPMSAQADFLLRRWNRVSFTGRARPPALCAPSAMGWNHDGRIPGSRPREGRPPAGRSTDLAPGARFPGHAEPRRL